MLDRNLQRERRMEKLGLFLVVIPPLTYWIYWTLNSSYWFNADPAAVYFVDSLSVFAGYSYKFVDHPGTPVHLIGSFLLALTYPFFNSQEAFIQFHLGRPGIFFLMTNTFLLVMNIICVLVFYKTVVTTLKYDRVLAGIALALLYFLLHPYSFPSLTFWSHNSFNFPFGTLWLLWLFNELSRNEELGWQKLMWMGFAAGILAVAQSYFIVWLVSGTFTIFVFILRSGKTIRQALRSSINMLIGGIFGIFIMLVPVYKELPRFAGWLTEIITHQGLYGTGESGIYTLAMIPISISYWWATIRLMMLILLSTLIALGLLLAWTRRSHQNIAPADFAMIAGILLQTGLVLFVMSKVVLRLRFSLSLAALLPVLILLVLKVSESAPRGESKLKRLLYAAVLIGVITTLTQQIGLQQRRAFVARDAPIAREQAVKGLAERAHISEKDLVIVYAFAVPVKCAGLLLASNWTGSFENEISRICPNQYIILDVNEGLDADFNTVRPIMNIKDIDWDLVVWPGNGSDLPEYLRSIGAINIPNSWRVRRDKWFFIKPIGG